MAVHLLPILALGAVGALLLLSRSGGTKPKKPGEPGGPPLTSGAETAMLMPSADGQLMYKPDYRPYLVQALRTKELEEGAQFGEQGEITFARMIEREAIVDPNNSAYEGAKALHSLGLNIWVTPTLLTADAGERHLLATPQGVNPPPASFVALLASYADTWPETASPPAPPLEEPPPAPNA